MSRVFIQHGECAAIARMLAVVAACSKPLPSSLFFLLFLLVDLLFWGSRGQVGGFLLDFSRSSTFITPARSTYSRVIFRHSPTVNVWLSLSATVDVAVDVNRCCSRCSRHCAAADNAASPAHSRSHLALQTGGVGGTRAAPGRPSQLQSNQCCVKPS